MTDGPDPFESAVVGIIRILAPWPPEQRAKILQGADYCFVCGKERNKSICKLEIWCDGVNVYQQPEEANHELATD